MTTAWLIEYGTPAVYFCEDEQWCSNASHARRFPTEAEACAVAQQMFDLTGYMPRVAEHAWVD